MQSGDGKSDMERLGVFMEMSYISVGDKYSPPNSRPFNELAYQSRQMQAGVTKQLCALQSGFFDKSFKRIFEREALNEPLRLARQNRIQQAKKNMTKAFLPSNETKKPCGSGSHYGTLSGPIEAMSPLSVPKKTHCSPGRNILTSPLKKGSGYSYPNVTLSKMDLYAPDPYDRAKETLKVSVRSGSGLGLYGPFRTNFHPQDYFQHNPYHSDKPLPPAHKPLPPQKNEVLVPFKPSSPSKRSGGMKAGTFGTYPSHSAEPYGGHSSKPANQETVFYPAPGPKSTPVKSIITVNVNRKIHSTNYTSTTPTVMIF
uniref:Cilia-and flagella-associated protein 96 n=1 Tax=Kryptolebias marmoratus TaxID=37003 RepID=A0A3Q3A0E4_KRYMA